MIFGGFTPCSEIELKFFIGTVNQNHFLKIRAPPVELSPLLLTGQKGRLDLLVQTLSCLCVSTRKDPFSLLSVVFRCQFNVCFLILKK